MPLGEAVYPRLPVLAQHLAASAGGLRITATRYGRGFWKALAEAEGRRAWDQEEIARFRDARLRAMVAHAFATVPHYRDVARKRGLAASDIGSLGDLEALPVLTKAEVQDAPGRFVSSAVPVRHRVGAHTSGTTGAGLHFSTTCAADQEQWAVWWRYRRSHGIDLGTWCGYFGGRSIVSLDQHRPPFWRYNWPGKQILFSGYHLGPATIGAYLSELRRKRPPWLHGYPSLISLLAAHLLDSGDDLGYQVRWITTGAESLLPGQAALVTRAFGVRPLENYGMAEAVANASTCERGTLHIDEDFSAVELVEGEHGSLRIVGTNLTNRAMPLLRYDTGDVVSAVGAACSCGRPGRVLSSVDGRCEDYVVLRNGSRVGRMDHVFKDLVNVREAQIYQAVAGAIEVRVVKGVRWSSQDEERLLREFRNRIGDDTAIRVRYEQVLSRTANGKLRLVVSSIPDGQVSTQ